MSHQDAVPLQDQRSAIDKAMHLLRAFGEDSATGIGVTELARRADLPKSTAFRVLASLQANHAVEKVGNVYRLGPMMTELDPSKHGEHYDFIRDVLTPSLAELYAQTHQTVHLAIPEGTDVVYINKLFGRLAVRSPSRIGGRVPAYCTGVGKALMAFSPAMLEGTLDQEMIPWTANTITTADALEYELSTVRSTGLAFDREEILRGLNCVAAPVWGPENQAVAALSVSGPVGRFQPASASALLRNVCFDASRTIQAAFSARDRQNSAQASESN